MFWLRDFLITRTFDHVIFWLRDFLITWFFYCADFWLRVRKDFRGSSPFGRLQSRPLLGDKPSIFQSKTPHHFTDLLPLGKNFGKYSESLKPMLIQSPSPSYPYPHSHPYPHSQHIPIPILFYYILSPSCLLLIIFIDCVQFFVDMSLNFFITVRNFHRTNRTNFWPEVAFFFK